jgi:hypothetical protein
LPRPRSPSIRSRPVFDVVASRRRTSGRENVSRVPCNANAVPPEWIVPPSSPAFVGIRLGRSSPAQPASGRPPPAEAGVARKVATLSAV